MSFSKTFTHPELALSVVVDDDDRLGVALLLDPSGDIIGDVWLYNRLPAPEVVDFGDPTQAPFLNPASLARPLPFDPPHDADELAVEWLVDEELLLADIFVSGLHLARLSPGSTPGWNVLALAEGPLARPLDLSADLTPGPGDEEE
jgi:hypothetical protein